MAKKHEKALFEREAEVDEALRSSIPRSPAQLEKTVLIAAKAIIEAIYQARY